jgi:hypothetical protein
MDGGTVVAGDTLVVSATAFDYERLAIPRPGLQLMVRLTGVKGLRLSEMQYMDGNLYRFEVPSSWVEDAGSYSLNISSDLASAVEIRFTVSSASQNAYIALGIAAVRASSIRG